ncbi:MAG: GTPase Era [Deltaproteobacteria bacterium]|nr:GTPase Era [Deltaproteobacteria bacterium]
MAFRSGFISIIGRPNSGKSTLLNAFLGEKISIVSDKPQTTRNVIRGVKNLKDCQVIFIDTPGIHRGKGLLNEFMVREALSSIKDVDGVVYLVEADKSVSEDDRYIIEGLKRLKCPVVLGLNKVDRVEKGKILPLMDEFSKRYPFKEIVPISALKGDGVELLLRIITELLPEGPRYFPEDSVTDLPERFIAAEMVREKVFLFTEKEVPYSVAVAIDKFEDKKEIISISATINVERDSQKGIIIGKGGSMLKRIGSAARHDIERLLGSKVYLELFVRVQKEWTKKPGALKDFGY